MVDAGKLAPGQNVCSLAHGILECGPRHQRVDQLAIERFGGLAKRVQRDGSGRLSLFHRRNG